MLTESFPTGQAVGISVDDTRQVLSGFIACNRDGSPRPGVLTPFTKLVSGTDDMAYTVAPFRAALSRNDAGIELVALKETIVLSTPEAPPSGSRVDRIFVRSRFSGLGDGSDAPEIGVVQGEPSVSPELPDLPEGALELARAAIPLGITETSQLVITQTVPFTAAAGASVPFRNLAELQGWTTAAEGQQAHILETAVSQRFVYKNAAWIDTVPPLYACEKTHTATQSVAQGSGTTTLSWNTISYNRGGLVQSATQLRAPIAGVYQIEANFIVTNLQPIEVIGRFYKNGSAIAASEARSPAVTNAYKQVHLSVSLVLAAGDLITCGVAQWSGGALSVAPSSCRFLMRRLGD